MTTIPLTKLQEIERAMDRARLLFHSPQSTERDLAFRELAWQSGVLVHYVKAAKVQQLEVTCHE